MCSWCQWVGLVAGIYSKVSPESCFLGAFLELFMCSYPSSCGTYSLHVSNKKNSNFDFITAESIADSFSNPS